MNKQEEKRGIRNKGKRHKDKINLKRQTIGRDIEYM